MGPCQAHQLVGVGGQGVVGRCVAACGRVGRCGQGGAGRIKGVAGHRPEQVQQAAGCGWLGQAFVVEGDLTQQVQLAFGAGHGHVEQAL